MVMYALGLTVFFLQEFEKRKVKVQSYSGNPVNIIKMLQFYVPANLG